MVQVQEHLDFPESSVLFLALRVSGVWISFSASCGLLSSLWKLILIFIYAASSKHKAIFLHSGISLALDPCFLAIGQFSLHNHLHR